MPRVIPRLLAIVLACLGSFTTSTRAAPPSGFTLEPWPGDWAEICGIAAVGDGRFVAWERGGVAWMVGPDGIASVEPLIDISEEVGAWRDHGLLGLALDPAFDDNGFVYLLYTVDRHHLLYSGTPEYDPEADWYFAATIARITRYTATEESDRAVVDPSSRTILLGESIGTGLPILHESHAAGALAFGTDGTLLCSMGDSASFIELDLGGAAVGGWVPMALEDGIIDPWQDIGAFRAQFQDSLCGKFLRLDPDTGDGVPSNPWFDPAAPRSAASRVWTVGVRNGYRIAVTPGSGSDDPAAGDPGQIVYGDVGWSSREEAGTVDGPGRNLGWPLFEGLEPRNGYWSSDLLHPTAVNPLAGEGCPDRFRFRDLLAEDGEIATNPCDPAWLVPTDWSGPSLATNWGGYTGDGFLDFGNGVGEWIDFEFEAVDDKPHLFAVRYANGGSSARPVEILLDGSVITTLAMRPTGAWNRWSKAQFQIALDPGPHTLRIRTTIGNGPNVDRIDTPDRPHTPIPSASRFTHHRPRIEWKHGVNEARVPVFDLAGMADQAVVGSKDSPISGDPFGGNCATGGPMITDPRWPAEWRGMFFADYIYGWIRVLRFDTDGLPTEVASFDPTAGPITAITHDPASASAVMIRWDQNPVRIVPPASTCPADLNGDGEVSGADLGLLLSNWAQPGLADLDGDGTTGGSDLGLMLAAWGFCGP